MLEWLKWLIILLLVLEVPFGALIHGIVKSLRRRREEYYEREWERKHQDTKKSTTNEMIDDLQRVLEKYRES